MKKYNIKNYIRYKEDIKQSMPNNKPYSFYTRNELIVKFLPLVENISRKFATSQEASGVMSINDIIQEGSLNLCKAVDKIDWEKVSQSDGR
jgi:DNA-directed RNA polymerase specialized sigma subunit